MCNCDVQAEALTELPGEDLSALDDTKFVAALEGMGVEKAPPLGIHFGVSNEWQTLALTPTFSETFLERYGRFITPEHREFFDPEPRRYNFPIMTSLEDGRLPPPLSDHAFALNPRAERVARLAKAAEASWAERLAKDLVLAGEAETRKVGSRDWWAGKEEGAPSPGPFLAEGMTPGVEIRSSPFVPRGTAYVLTEPYRTMVITGIAGEVPKAHAPAFIRHLGESEEQVAMLLAQMSAPLGACTCQRINGFLFACLACSKAGKA